MHQTSSASSTATKDGKLESSMERQRHRPEAVGPVIDEREILGVFRSLNRRIVTDHDGAGAQMRMNQFQCRPRHADPDIDEREVYRTLQVLQRLAQIALAQLDEIGQSGGAEIGAR